MTAPEFIAKWSKVDLTERSAAQQHFLDLCELVGHPKPAAADPTGESFTFEKGASKQGGGDGWADVWKKDFFGWEYKGRHKDLAAAAKELNDLRERWLNPPEWTVEKVLEFPGSVNGPWSRYIVPSTINPQLSTGLVRYPRLEPRDADCAARLKKRTLTNLYNERPAWLDLAHKKLDVTVAAAYGWPTDLSDEQILERSLALNLERGAEEQTASETTRLK